MQVFIAIVCFLIGALGWTFLEYTLHRFDGHGRKGKSLFSREHLTHHAVKDYFSPNKLKAMGTIPVVLAGGALSIYLFGWLVGVSLTVGLSTTYVAYEVFHWWLHVSAPRNFYGRWARKHHFGHHFIDARMNHGVTTPLWDIVFGTYMHVDKLQVPEKFAMRWLRDGNSGPVKEVLRDEYEIVTRGRPDPEAELVRNWGVTPTA